MHSCSNGEFLVFHFSMMEANAISTVKKLRWLCGRKYQISPQLH